MATSFLKMSTREEVNTNLRKFGLVCLETFNLFEIVKIQVLQPGEKFIPYFKTRPESKEDLS